MGLFDRETWGKRFEWIKRTSQTLVSNKTLVFWLCMIQLAVISDYVTDIIAADHASNIIIGIFVCTGLVALFLITSVLPMLRRIKMNALKLLQPLAFFLALFSLPLRLAAEWFSLIILFHLSFFAALIAAFLLLYFAVHGGMFIPTTFDQMLTFLRYNSKRGLVNVIVPQTEADAADGSLRLGFILRPMMPTENDTINPRDEVIPEYSIGNGGFCIPMGIRRGSGKEVVYKEWEPATATSLERLKRDQHYVGKLTSGFTEFQDNTSTFMLLMALSDDRKWTSNGADKIAGKGGVSNFRIGEINIHLNLSAEDLSRAAARIIDPVGHPIIRNCFDVLMQTFDPRERLKVRNYLILLSQLGKSPDYNLERWLKMVQAYCNMMENPAVRTQNGVHWFYSDGNHLVVVNHVDGSKQPYQMVVDGGTEGRFQDKPSALFHAKQYVDQNLSATRDMRNPMEVSDWEEKMDDIARQPVENFIHHHDKMMTGEEGNAEIWIDLDAVISKMTTQIHAIKLRNPLSPPEKDEDGDAEAERSRWQNFVYNDENSFKMKTLVNQRKGIVVGVTIATETLFSLIPEA